MEKRLVTFLLLSFVVVTANMMFVRWMQPPPPPKPAAVAEEKPAGDDQADQKGADEAAAEGAGADAAAAEAPKQAAASPAEIAEESFTLGSADPKSGYRLLVTGTNRGAAIARIECNSPKYLDQEDRSGYVGHLDLAALPNNVAGAVVRVVGPGTPAAEAGLKPGDIITELNGKAVIDPESFEGLLHKTEPGSEFELTVQREEKALQLTGQLRRRPMQVVRPEPADDPDPLSFLLTMESIDGKRIPKDADELPGIAMLTANWQVLPGAAEDEVSLQYDLTEYGLQVIKHFKLSQVDPADRENPTAPAYDLGFSIEVRNVGAAAHKVAWRLDGPTGLPLEGAWYAMKIGPNWRGGAGMRDVVVGFWRKGQVRYGLVSATTIADDKDLTPWQDEPLEFIGVDSQYFAVALVPQKTDTHEVNYGQAIPIHVGEVPEDRSKRNRTNVSFRLVSKAETVAPQGKAFTETYKIFAGPKKPELLAQYGLGKLVYYGLFGWVAEPMLAVLHFFYRIIPNYGIAIILLTVLVRSLMFPISRRQAMNAQKMQELQPEIKRIQEKYKGNLEARSKAQQELFKKHNYHPLAGCLPVFLQLPIFIGLYRSLSVDVELRGAPLISEAIRWCSNLAAPDMLWNWEPYLPAVLAGQNGWLGPFFNVFPCISAGLFIIQQRKMMPPPADEQAAMQQKIMQYMTILIGIMFFKVASGLCLYLISSSIWSMTERKLLPKNPHRGAGSPPITKPAVRAGLNGNGSGGSKRKNRGRT